MKTVFLLLSLSLVAFAQQPDPAKLRQHVTYLASDELEGRRPGSEGGNKAAKYIADQFEKLKLGCATPDFKCSRDGYRHQFPFIASVELGKNNSLKAGTQILPLRQAWIPIGYSSNSVISNVNLEFAGYGLTVAELNHDDYSKTSPAGKVAVAFAGTPDGDNPHGQFGRFGDARWKAIAAKDHGARALIVISGTDEFRDERLARLSYDQTSGEAGIPVIVISRQTAASLFGLSSVSELTTLEKTPAKWSEAAKKLQSTPITLSVEITRKEVPAYNIVGVLEGSDPALKNEYIVIGAHYDHLGHGGESSLSPNSNAIHHGADDNASGTAGVLELARTFSARRNELRRSVVFIAFSGEESGLLGSKAWVNNPGLPLKNAVAMINMDMIGRLRDDKLTIGGMGTAPELKAWVEKNNSDNLKLQFNEDGFGPSDHSSFYAKQIPVLFFFSGTHDDYHKPSDVADKINYDGEAKILNLVSGVAKIIDRADARPTYTLARSQNSGRSSGGFRVYLGTVPNYADSNDGLLLDGVREDSPASRAGIKTGDKIVKLAGREIKNVYDYTYALGEMRANQEYEVEVIRSGERLKMKLTPAARN